VTASGRGNTARTAGTWLLLACAPALAADDGAWRSANVLSAEGRSPLAGQVESLGWLAGSWVEFALLAVEPGRAAWFDGLTYRIDDQGGLEAYVISQHDDGTERELAFRFRPAPLAGD
jgi:hypothetical protein